MTTSVEVLRILGGRRQRTGRVAVAAFLLAWDILLLPWAAAYVLGFRLPFLDVGPEVYAGWLTSAPIAALVGALSVGSLVSVWLCSEFRGFLVVMAFTAAWIIFSVAAQWQAELGAVFTASFLLRKVLAAALLWSGRRAFAPIPR